MPKQGLSIQLPTDITASPEKRKEVVRKRAVQCPFRLTYEKKGPPPLNLADEHPEDNACPSIQVNRILIEHEFLPPTFEDTHLQIILIVSQHSGGHLDTDDAMDQIFYVVGDLPDSIHSQVRLILEEDNNDLVFPEETCEFTEDDTDDFLL